MNRIQGETMTITLRQEAVYKGYLALVNADVPVAQQAARCLSEIAPGILLEKRTAINYNKVMKQVCSEGKLVPVSGYRSRAEQERIFSDTARKSGTEYAKTYVARPGCSEHQTGLAIDVALKSDAIDFIAPDFPYEGICQQFRETAFQHGFIQRYPKGKEHITGIGHEPWHFRYVGVPHAMLMISMNFTLEEYIDWVRDYPLYSRPYHFQTSKHLFLIGYISLEDAAIGITLPSAPYTISGNNMDGFVVAMRGDSYE